VFANRLTLMQRVFGRGLRVRSPPGVVEVPFAASITNPRCVIGRILFRLHLILGQAYLLDVRPGPVLFIYAVTLILLYTTIERRNDGVYRRNRRLSSFVRLYWQLPVN
jgi:hypothetical protein